MSVRTLSFYQRDALEIAEVLGHPVMLRERQTGLDPWTLRRAAGVDEARLLLATEPPNSVLVSYDISGPTKARIYEEVARLLGNPAPHGIPIWCVYDALHDRREEGGIADLLLDERPDLWESYR